MKIVGRNGPCPCGSGKKYKRCHDVQTPKAGAGIRVPLLIISPFVKAGTVYSKFGTFDSLLGFVEANWRLGSLLQRDRTANNLMDAFQFAGQAERTPALILPLLKAPKMSPQQIKRLNEQVLKERWEDPEEETH